MASAGKSSRSVESRNDLVETLSRGSKPAADWRIGTEHEKFTFYRSSHQPVPYFGADGIRALLSGILAEGGWEPEYDGENMIGLNHPGDGAISLEPGGQFELSGAPLKNLHETCHETHEHLKLLHRVAEPLGIAFLGIGVAPTWSVADIPAMPKSRYGIMTPYMKKKGALGTSMMYRSSTVQVNMDFSDEADMVKKLRVGLALQPVATALFANSPFMDGQLTEYLSNRSRFWLDTDPDRTGMLPFAFEEGMGFERYVDYALDVPMYFVKREGRYIDCAGESFRDFLDGRLPQLPGEVPTLQDWEDHLSTLFPEVRMKQFLEMRGADGGPWQGICALPALWTGILYDSEALDAAWNLVKDWTEEERDTLRLTVPKTAIHTPFRNQTVADLGRQMVDISRGGLKRRGQKNWEGADESIFLASLERTLTLDMTPAERLVELYRGEWNGDIDWIFEEAAF